MTSESADEDLQIRKPYLEISVKQAHEQLHVAFPDAAAVASWAKTEHSFWNSKRANAVAILKKMGFSNAEFGGPFFQPFSELEKAARDHVPLSSAEPSDRVREAAAGLIRAIEDGELVASESTVGQHLMELEKSAPLEFALAIALGHGAGLSVSVQLPGRAQGELQLKALLDGYRARFPARISEIDPQGIVFGERVAKMDDLLGKATEGLREIESLRQTLRQKVATEQAVTIWGERAKTHNDRRHMLLFWIVITFLGLIGVIMWALSLDRVVSLMKEDPWMHFVVLGLPILAGIWIVRMLTVLYRVDIAAAQDAAERVAMVETLQALHAESKTAPNEAERMLVMGALFRPGPSADHDPSLPNTIVEQIARATIKEKTK